MKGTGKLTNVILVLLLVLGALFAQIATVSAANPSDYPGSVDNGDGTYTLVYQPSGGANDGTDQGGLNSGKDAGVLTGIYSPTQYANTNYGSSPLHGHWNSTVYPYVRGYSYHQWDVSALPPSEDVVSVMVVFYQKIGIGYGWSFPSSTNTMLVQAPVAPWNEMTLTWNNKPATEPVSQVILQTPNPGVLEGSFRVVFDGYVSIDITNLYKDWKTGARPNYGIVYQRLEAYYENATSNSVYTSDNPDSAKRPCLKIVYRGSVAGDTTAPVIVPTVTGTLGNNGWYTSNVTVSWTVTDGESEVTSIIGGETTAITEDTAGVTLTCEATSAGGTASASVTVKRDATAPVVSASKSPEPNSYDWNNTDVTVQFTASDALSGIDLLTPAIIVTAEGIDQSVTGTAADAAGNVASVTETGINIDKTPPVITYTGNAGTYSIDQMVNITCSATDTLSSVSSDTCQNIIGPAYSFPGVNTFSSEAIDQAGNSASASTSFNVQVSYDGLRKLVKEFVTKQGIINSLLAKLNAAEAADARGNNGAADNIINAFINELEAQTGKAISPEQASILIKLVEDL